MLNRHQNRHRARPLAAAYSPVDSRIEKGPILARKNPGRFEFAGFLPRTSLLPGGQSGK